MADATTLSSPESANPDAIEAAPAPSVGAEAEPPPHSEHSDASTTGRISDSLVGLLIFLAVFTVYGLTACRTIYTGDDGDFITAIVTTGIPHPTGYPLFCLLGKLFVTILAPLGEPALRINLMTAAFGAAAVAMAYRFFALLISQRVLAIFTALLLAFTPTLWQQSLSCEVYSLTCLFLTTLLYQAKRWGDDPMDARRLKVMTFTYGLSLTNHMTMALFFPAFLAFVLWKRRTLFKEVGLLLTMVGLFVVPLLLYAYLPLAAHFSNAPVKWGNPVTLDAFLAHLTGRQYRERMFQHPLTSYQHLPMVGGFLLHEYGWWFVWLVPVGWWTLFRNSKNRPVNYVMTWVIFANLVYNLNYEIADIYVYFLPTYAVCAAWIAVGMGSVLEFVWSRMHAAEEVRSRHLRLLIPLLLAVTIVHVSLHYAETDQSGNYLESQLAANILRTAPPNAVVVQGEGLTTFSLWYRQFVLGERPDVVCISFSLFLGRDYVNYWYVDDFLRRRYPAVVQAFPDGNLRTPDLFVIAASMQRLITQALAAGRPVLLIPSVHAQDPVGQVLVRDLSPNYDRVPYGILERLYPRGSTPPAAALYAETAPLWDAYQTRGLYSVSAHMDPFQDDILRTYAQGLFGFGRVAETAGRYDTAADAYGKAAQIVIPFPEAEAAQKRCEERIGRQGTATEPGTRGYPVPSPSAR